MKIDRVVGIDLGTTNSCVAVMNDTQTEIVCYRTGSGRSTLPSCIYYDNDTQEILVGIAAYACRGRYPAPVTSIKRCMGKTILTPIGKAGSLPKNLPPLVKQALTESRDDRINRYLQRITASSPEMVEKLRESKRKDPPDLWQLDQEARLNRYFSAIEDGEEKKRVADDPPLLWLPEEISALILAEERRLILEYLNVEEPNVEHVVDRASITVPAYFDANQTESTRESGVLAGLKVVEMIAEPSAAAMYYCWEKDVSDDVLMVFDLGGGTFDVSILKIENRHPTVLGISGDNLLGGDDMDKAVARWLIDGLKGENPLYSLNLKMDVEKDRCILEGLAFLGETIKKGLSGTEIFPFRDTSRTDLKGLPLAIDVRMERTQFESLIRDTVWRCIPKCWEAIAKAHLKANVSLEDIGAILLVGGSTYVPLVSEMVQKHFCTSPRVKPKELEEYIKNVTREIEGDDEITTKKMVDYIEAELKRGVTAGCKAPTTCEPDLCVALGAAASAARHGVIRTDDQVSIDVTSDRTTDQLEITISGTAMSRTGEDLAGAKIILESDGGLCEEINLDENNGFVLTNIPLTPNSINDFRLSIEQNGDYLGEVNISVEQKAESKVMGGVKPVVPMPYRIKRRVRGSIVKETLIPSGQELPTTSNHQFGVPDNHGGIVHFIISQGFRQLKRITALIDPATRPGESIDFKVEVDTNHLMVINYRIGKNPEWHSSVIEPPACLALEQVEIDDRLKRIKADLQHLSPIEQATTTSKVERIAKAIGEAKSMGDEPVQVERCAELVALQEELADAAAPMYPPWEVYEDLCKDCEYLVGVLEDKKPEFPAIRTREDLAEKRQKAKSAFDHRDRVGYVNEKNDLEKEKDSLMAEAAKAVKINMEKDGGSGPSDFERAIACCDQIMREAEGTMLRAEKLALEFMKKLEVADVENRPKVDTALDRCDEIAQKMRNTKAETKEMKDKIVDSPEIVIRWSIKAQIQVENSQTQLTNLAKFEKGENVPI